MLEPILQKSSALKQPPHRAKLRTDKELPKVVNAVKLIPSPSRLKPRIDTELPKSTAPKIDIYGP
jgi:hypothetical protein